MKKIKTACVDKLLALSSCFVITNCDKSAEDKKDGKKYAFNRLDTFVGVSFLENILEFNNKTLKGVIDKNLPNSFDNSRIPIQFRQLSPRDVIDCLTKINDSLGSGKSHEDIYSVLIYYNAYIRSFGIFGLRDEALIAFIGDLIKDLYEVCNELKNKKNLKREIIDWFNPDSKNTTIPYGDIKKFFNDICIAFICSKDVADLTLPSEHFLSKIERDTEKAVFLICCDQIESHTSEILKKVNDNMNDWKHSDSPNELNYAGNTSNGTFSNVNLAKTIHTKNEILATIRDSNKTGFSFNNLDGSKQLTHNNPRSINTKDHVNSIDTGIKEITAILTHYADKKKEINRDSEEFKKDFANIDANIERLLTALIYRGIQYNQFLVSSKTLKPLFYFTSQQKPLDSLKDALNQIPEYTGNILSGILGKIFEATNSIKQVTDPHQGVISIDLTALKAQIDDFNNKILNDRILFELAYNARRYLTDLFTGTNADFIKNVPNKITEILTNHNEKVNDYGNFLKGVCNFLSTWNYDKNKDNGDTTANDPTKWACQFPKFEYNKDNNPFIFEDGKGGQKATDAAGFDFAFNDVQDILYEKYADCVLPETFLECQQLFKRTRDICVTSKESGLFYKIANLHEANKFQTNTSLRSLDLLKICLPAGGSSNDKSMFYNFFNRLPNTKGEYIKDAETWTIDKENNDKEKIIDCINNILGLVENRQNKECPKIDDAIGKLTNFILIDNPNEVIDICNYKGYEQDFTEWKNGYCLLYNVDNLKDNLKSLDFVSGKGYKNDDNFTLDDFESTSPQNMVEKCNEQDFGSKGDSFPALFAAENKFDEKYYSIFHDNVYHIENNLYYVLCCIKTLGASIPRRFLKDSGKNQNLLDSYRNCRNLSLLIENALTNVLIACARPDESVSKVTGWKMLGWNDNCKLHTQSAGNWGQYDIFQSGDPENGAFKKQYSPFYSEIEDRDSRAQTWEQSFLDYKKTVTESSLKTSLDNLKCGFFNYANRRTLIWNKTDFNNYICIGNPEKHIDSTYPRVLYYKGENPYDTGKGHQISCEKIIPEFSGFNTVVTLGNPPKNPCLLFNEKIAQQNQYISFSNVLEAYHSNSNCGVSADYLSLTYDNTRKRYSFTTFGNNTPFQYSKDKNHNFSELLNNVKECINNFSAFYNDKEVFTSLQKVNFTNDKSKALLKLYLRNRSIKDIKEYAMNFLNCFITFKDEDLNNLKKYIINVGNNENYVNSFANMTHRKQFYTEIYGVQDKDFNTTKKIDRYNEVFKLFNLGELQGGSVFTKRNHILDENGKATGSYCSNFDQILKGKVEDFFGIVHEKWCQEVMTYSTGSAADKKLQDIFNALGEKYDTLKTEVIDAVKTLKANIGNIGDWFTNRYNGKFLNNLKDCVGKIGDDKTDSSALKELKELLETIKPGVTTGDNPIDPTNVKNKLNEVYESLDDVINNLPNEDDNELKSIFVLKPNEGKDEIDKYKDYKDKLEKNKTKIEKYKNWLDNYDRTILKELKTCFQNLNNHKTSLKDLKDNIYNAPFDADFNVLKTLLGEDSVVGSIKKTCKDLKEKLNNSPKVFFDNSDTVKQSFNSKLGEFNTILNNLITSADLDIQDLEKEYDKLFIELADFLFGEEEEKSFCENFDQKVYQKINDQIQSLQNCIGDIDKMLKEHLKAELEKVQTLLGETKTTLTSLDDLTKTDDQNSYMGTMKYIFDNKDQANTSIGKLLHGVHVADDGGALEKVVNWKKENIDKGKFYHSLDDIKNGLNDMLQAHKGNDFAGSEIIIAAADDNYGDRVNITQATIIDNDALSKMAKDNLFNDDVLEKCLKG